MPLGYITPDTSPDTTPVMQYTVKVTQRDVDEIHHLVKRNYAGMTVAWSSAMVAVTKVLSQIAKQDEELVNYDYDGNSDVQRHLITCPTCKAPEVDN